MIPLAKGWIVTDLDENETIHQRYKNDSRVVKIHREGELPLSSTILTHIAIIPAFSWFTLDQLGIALTVIGDEGLEGFSGQDSDSETVDFDAEPPADRQLAYGDVVSVCLASSTQTRSRVPWTGQMVSCESAV